MVDILSFYRSQHMPKAQRFETQWGGRTLSIEVGKFAQQAGGSCIVQYGETVVLATATMSSHVRAGLNWFPLMVDFEEKLYAAGRIKGSRFMKREGRPTDEAVLTSRMIDRALRPLFDPSIRNDIQVIVTALAYDQENDPDVIGLIAASCALHMSDIPWDGPLAAARVGHIEGEFVLNPTIEQREESVLDLVFAGLNDKLIMVEAGANEASEDIVLGGFWHGLDNLVAPIKLIEEVRAAVGKEKRFPEAAVTDEDKEAEVIKEKVEAQARPFIIEQVQELFFKAPKATKGERGAAKGELKDRLKVYLTEQGVEEDHLGYGTGIVVDVLESEIHRLIVEEDRRVDGRSPTEIRELISEVAILPRVHGSAHFSRGETQVMTIATLGSPGDEQLLDGMRNVEKKRYFHHYNFPPYSVGEVKPMRGPSRRDIGHGGLAEKALAPMMPDKESFPYTVRTVSEVLGSNGSSSMGATCGSTLSLMDAGVPIKAPVAGLAMGLAMSGSEWKVLTDLQDLEDGKGGMDFKIAGSREGLTAIQMDTKTHGLSREIVQKTFEQALDARMEILDVIEKEIPAPRAELSPHAPRIISIRINPELIGNVIGPGGKIINGLIEETGVTAIDIDDDGLVMITSNDAEGAQKALESIKDLTREVVVGEIYTGKVVRLMDFGAIVEFLPKRDGMVHVSMMAPWRVEKVTDIVKLGDEVHVKVMEISADGGKISLSMKDAPGNKLPEKPAYKPREGGSSYGSRPRGNSSGGGNRPQGNSRPPARKPEGSSDKG
jgi:polyribonucleotide nucleotidyltransferase